LPKERLEAVERIGLSGGVGVLLRPVPDEAGERVTAGCAGTGCAGTPEPEQVIQELDLVVATTAEIARNERLRRALGESADGDLLPAAVLPE
jgi:hypothetical protein